MSLRITAMTLTLISALSSNAQGQSIQADGGTLNVAGSPIMSGGRISGCQLTFNSLVRDYTYRQGDYIAVSGGVSLMVTGDKLGSTVKIVATEFDKAGNPKPSPPTRAYLIGSNYETNLGSLITGTASDQPGGFFAVYQMQPTANLVMEALNVKRLIFAFNQKGGKTDIQMPVELDVLKTDASGNQTRGTVAVERFLQCVLALTKK